MRFERKDLGSSPGGPTPLNCFDSWFVYCRARGGAPPPQESMWGRVNLRYFYRTEFSTIAVGVACYLPNVFCFEKFCFCTMLVYYTYIFLLFLSYAFFYFLSYNIFIGLVYLEVASLSTSVLLVLHSIFHDDRYAEFFAIALITVAGAESAVAISLLVSINRLGVMLSSEEFSTLKG